MGPFDSPTLLAGVKPNPTTIKGSCCDVLFGSSLKNMWKLRKPRS